MFFRKTVVLTTRWRLDPAASRIPFTFSSTRSAGFATAPRTNSFVAGTSATWPEATRNPPDLIACEYGPIGFGPESVRTTSFMVEAPWRNSVQNRQATPQLQNSARESRLERRNA